MCKPTHLTAYQLYIYIYIYKPGTFQNLPGVLSQPFLSYHHKNGAPHMTCRERIAVHIASFARSGSLFQRYKHTHCTLLRRIMALTRFCFAIHAIGADLCFLPVGAHQSMWAERSGERSYFLRSGERLSEDSAPLRSLNTLSAAHSTQNAPLVIC